MSPSAIILTGAAYLIGAIPFGLLFSRAFGGEDPRRIGSGNIGATNVLRAGGRLPGLLTLFADIAKGALPVAVAASWFDERVIAAAAAAAFLGHIFPVYLRFRGGKGVATMFGVMLPWQPWAALAAFIAWFAVLKLSRYVAVASITAAVVLPFSVWLLGASGICIATTAGFALLVAVRHHQNIRRLLAGTEPTTDEDRRACGRV